MNIPLKLCSTFPCDIIAAMAIIDNPIPPPLMTSGMILSASNEQFTIFVVFVAGVVSAVVIGKVVIAAFVCFCSCYCYSLLLFLLQLLSVVCFLLGIIKHGKLKSLLHSLKCLIMKCKKLSNQSVSREL